MTHKTGSLSVMGDRAPVHDVPGLSFAAGQGVRSDNRALRKHAKITAQVVAERLFQVSAMLGRAARIAFYLDVQGVQRSVTVNDDLKMAGQAWYA